MVEQRPLNVGTRILPDRATEPSPDNATLPQHPTIDSVRGESNCTGAACLLIGTLGRVSLDYFTPPN
jgi:hypothetical protein